MKSSTKMGVIVLLGVCVLFLQYHLSTEVRLDQVAELNADNIPDDTDNLPIGNNVDICIGTLKITEETIRTAVHTVQKANGFSPDVGALLIQELINRLNKTSIVTYEEVLVTNARIEQSSQTTPPNVTSTLSTCKPPSETEDKNLDPLYIITPTYRRPEQIPELTRMSHTLMLVKNIHWLVIEDATIPTKQVTDLLKKTGLKYEHLIAPMPEKYKHKKGAKPRGVSNRNRGLQWLRANATKGVFYFADDDNTYDITLFDQIRQTKRVSMFPVGLCTKFGLSTPIVKNETFAGFYDGWIAGRKFPVDMAGFAVSVKFLHERPNATMPFRAGFEEDGFLKSLAPFEPNEIELLANKCTKVLAWHTQTKKNEPSASLNTKLYGSTNLAVLKQQIV